MNDVSNSGIVTPEAVLLDLPAAGIATRVAAKLVDLILQGLLMAVLSWIVLLLLGGGVFPRTAQVLLFVAGFVVVLVVPFVCEGLWNGRTPGKAMFGLRVVTLDGGPVSWRHCFTRGLAQIIDIYMMCGVFPAIVTSRSQRFGDLMAGTFVLVSRAGGRSAVPTAFYPPPGWEAYMASMDVGRLRPEQYRLIRAFLLRVWQLSPEARFTLAVRLADAVRSRVAPEPPLGVAPEQFLVCVASAYQHRNGGLVRREELIGYGRPTR